MCRFPMLRYVGVGLGAQNSFGASRGTDIPPTSLGEGQLHPRVVDNAPAPARAEFQAKPKAESCRVQPTVKLCS